ncbi:MAG: cobalamin-dependent protein [Magnetococcales bacterium]|nr:cobalamin-dependent protein [Magnetococcales bacterium]
MPAQSAPPFTVGLAQINISFANAHYLPLSAGLMQAYFQHNAANAADFHFLPPLYKRIDVEEAVAQLLPSDVVGFGLYMWNRQISLEIIRRLKQRKPEILILCGGPDVSERSEEFFAIAPEVDVAIHGEAEKSFCEVVSCFPERNWDDIPGIAYRGADGEIITHPRGDRIRDLDSIPSPYLTGVFDALMERDKGHEWLAMWETNRGCPFGCSFCDWGSNTKSKIFRFDMQRLQDELTWFAENRIEFIFCCDANFGILRRDEEIVRHVIDHNERFNYPQALSVQNTKNATERAYTIQKMLADHGLSKGVTLSMQSTAPTVLTAIGRENISLDTYDELQKRFTRDGISTYSDLLLGLPGETVESYLDGIASLIEKGQHNRIQFINCSILPNAEMGEPLYQKLHGLEMVESQIINMHGAIEPAGEIPHETQQLIVATAAMPREAWRRARTLAWWVALLHFDKVMQLPFIVLNQASGIAYRDLFQIFENPDPTLYPLLAEINQRFMARAQEIQEGGPEYAYAPEWLNIWWPDNEYMLIWLAEGDRWQSFYREVEHLIIALLQSRNIEIPETLLSEAIAFNNKLLKLPFRTDSNLFESTFNLFEIYENTRRGQEVTIQQGRFLHTIDRSSESWDDWDIWRKEVVWFGNKKGDYIHSHVTVERV